MPGLSQWEALGAPPDNADLVGITDVNDTDQSANGSSKKITVAELHAAAQEKVNLFINPLFNINQEGVSGTVTLSHDEYGHDGLKGGNNGCTYTFSTSGGVTTITITAGSLVHVVLGEELTAGDYTFSWEGTATAQVNGGGYGASPVTESIAGGSNINIEVGTGTFKLPQFEKGSYATRFIYHGIVHDKAKCHYRHKTIHYGTSIYSYVTVALRMTYNFEEMYTDPTVTFTDLVTTNCNGGTTVTKSASHLEVGTIISAQGTVVLRGTAELDARP